MNDKKIIAKLLITMQAAYIEQCNSGAVSAMEWITNTIEGPGLIPEITEGLAAQEFFDREMEKNESAIREAYGNQD